MRWLAVLLVATALAGCLGTSPGPMRDDVEERGAGWMVFGSFTPERTQEDLAAYCDVVRERSPGCEVMQSFPEQFGAWAPDEPGCIHLRERLLAIAHTQVGACAPEERAGPIGLRPRFHLDAWEANVSDGVGGSSRLTFDERSAWEVDGVVTLVARANGHEGEEAWLALWYRPRASPAGVYDAQAQAREEGTFDASYRGSLFRGGAITDLVRIDASSFVRIAEQDVEAGILRGTFLLDAWGTCDAACDRPGELKRVVLRGEFG